jgi:hypothetical protein
VSLALSQLPVQGRETGCVCPFAMETEMKSLMTLLFALVLNSSVLAAGTPALAGTWVFKADKSKGVGMMSAVAITAVITQTGPELKIHEITVSQGKEQTHDNTYDAAGGPKTNESPMGDKSSTVSHWENDKLVTTWTAPGAVNGTTVVRTETRSVSADGKTMTVEWSRDGKVGMVMVFDRQ